jgi:hypothetical protein
MLITRPEEFYRLWWVVVFDLETLWMRRPWPTGAVGEGWLRQKQKKRKKNLENCTAVWWSNPLKNFIIFLWQRLQNNGQLWLHCCYTWHPYVSIPCPFNKEVVIIHGGVQAKSARYNNAWSLSRLSRTRYSIPDLSILLGVLTWRLKGDVSEESMPIFLSC